MTLILVVDDNEENRNMLVYRLARKGYAPVTAADGLEGIRLARTQAPALILMDMSMPVLDGWEATRRLKADPATAGIPVIALTAHAMVGDREKALAAGCDDYATKPIDWADLLDKMRRCLDREAAP